MPSFLLKTHKTAKCCEATFDVTLVSAAARPFTALLKIAQLEEKNIARRVGGREKEKPKKGGRRESVKFRAKSRGERGEVETNGAER